MKIRNGFVSNSSSSSFIIGLLKITDKNKKKVEKFIKSLTKVCAYDVYTTEINEFFNGKYYEGYVIRVDENKIYNIAPVNSEPSLSLPYESKSDKFLIVNIGNNEGDGAFWNNETEELEYDKVDDSYFTGEQKEILKFLINQKAVYMVGADRNG
jgi:hypothetical protein